MHCYAIVGRTAPATIEGYLDGVAEASAVWSSLPSAAAPVTIGAIDPSRAPYGVFDEARLYATALSDASIAALPPGPR
jgi:hypothetical protein